MTKFPLDPLAGYVDGPFITSDELAALMHALGSTLAEVVANLREAGARGRPNAYDNPVAAWLRGQGVVVVRIDAQRTVWWCPAPRDQGVELQMPTPFWVGVYIRNMAHDDFVDLVGEWTMSNPGMVEAHHAMPALDIPEPLDQHLQEVTS